MSEGVRGRLSDVVEIIMGQSPTGDTCNDSGIGLPLLNGPTEFGGNHPNPVQFTTDPRKVALPGDLLFCVRGSTTGRMNWADQKYAIGRGLAAIRPKQGYELRHFIRAIIDYNLQNLLSTATGSTFPNVSRDQILSIECAIPPLPTQRRIAHILGTLDDKIELNRRMNATLEEMARTLFKSWFVDFDPVRAKMEGRQPAGMDAETAALFPSSFENSAIGSIPADWDTSRIGSKLKTILGGTPSRANLEYWTDGTIAWINSGKTNEFRIIEPSEWITNEALENSATKLLPPRTTVLAITGATLGQVSITEIECCANQSVIAIPASEHFPTEFIYPWIVANIEKLIASQTGGAQQHINKRNVEELALLCPNRRVIAAYQARVKPLFDQIATNCFQSRTLAMLRDTLLPKLMGGELSVSANLKYTS